MLDRERLGERNQRAAVAISLPGLVYRYATYVRRVTHQIDSHDSDVPRVEQQEHGMVRGLPIVRMVRIVHTYQPSLFEQHASANAMERCPFLFGCG